MPVLPSSSRFRIASTMLSYWSWAILPASSSDDGHRPNHVFFRVRLDVRANRVAADEINKLHAPSVLRIDCHILDRAAPGGVRQPVRHRLPVRCLSLVRTLLVHDATCVVRRLDRPVRTFVARECVSLVTPRSSSAIPRRRPGRLPRARRPAHSGLRCRSWTRSLYFRSCCSIFCTQASSAA